MVKYYKTCRLQDAVEKNDCDGIKKILNEADLAWFDNLSEDDCASLCLRFRTRVVAELLYPLLADKTTPLYTSMLIADGLIEENELHGNAEQQKDMR